MAFPVRVAADAPEPRPPAFFGAARNVSEIGIGVRLDAGAIATLTARERNAESVAARLPLLLDFRLPGERHWTHCDARLVWHAATEKGETGTVGLEFTRVPVSTELALDRFVGRSRPR